jgi:hypothetical protein
MNYRKALTDNSISLEDVFINYLGMNITIVPQTGSPSNKHTFNALFFKNDIDTSSPDYEKQMLQDSVFNDEFIEETTKSLSDNEPLYYIIHLNKSFPTGSKHSVLLSNMANKNYSGKEQPPAIRKILYGIDYSKLCNHISEIIDKAIQNNEKVDVQLKEYITSVLQTDKYIYHALTNDIVCNTDAEYLTWFLLYALFDENNFSTYIEAYKQKHINVNAAPHSFEVPAYDENVLKLYKRNNICKKLSTDVLIALYCLQIMFLAVPFSNHLSQTNTSSMPFLMYTIIMLTVSIVLIALRYIPFHYSQTTISLRMELQNMHPNEYSLTSSDRKVTFSDTSKSYTTIWNIRRIMIASLPIIIIIFLIISIWIKSFPIFICSVTLCVAIYIYADHLLNSIYVYHHYDSLFYDESKEYNKTNIIDSYKRGKALLLTWNYNDEKGSFTCDNYYNTKAHSDECIRYIMNQVVDSEQSRWNIISAVMLAVNVVNIVIGIVQFIIPCDTYFDLPSDTYYSIFCILFIFFSGVVNIYILLNADKHYSTIGYFRYYSSMSSSNKVYLQQTYYKNYINGTINDIHIVRGIYNYCQNMFEQGIPVEQIMPEADRTTMQHIHISSVNRNIICSLLLDLTILCLVWHFDNLYLLFAIPVNILLFSLITFVISPKIRKRNLILFRKKYIEQQD